MDTSFLTSRTRPARTTASEPLHAGYGQLVGAGSYGRSSYAAHASVRPSAGQGRHAIGAMGLIAATALAALAIMGALALGELAAGTPGGSSALASANDASTPASQWHRGSVPFLYQTDDAWGAGSYGAGTLATHGCGPTCLSMAYIGLTGRTDRDPTAMAAFSESNGFVEEGITTWALMTEGANLLGLSATELPANAEQVREALLADHPVICSMGPGDFTTDGHFIVLVDANPDGTVSLRDPNSPDRSARTWDLDRIFAQCRNLWALSA